MDPRDPRAQGPPTGPASLRPQSPQEPVQTPEVYNSPSLAAMPYGAQPAPQPQTAAVTGPVVKKGPNKLVIIVIAGIALLVIVAGAVLLTSSGGKPAPTVDTTTQTNTQSQSLQPAQAIDLEQTNNAIGQDLSSVDDEADFPANSLDDKTLGL